MDEELHRTNAAELADTIEFYDASGWESLDDVLLYVTALMWEAENLARLAPGDAGGYDLDALRQRAREVAAAIDAEEALAEAWADAAVIRVWPIPEDIVERAERFRPERSFENVMAHCRHRLTNYHDLLGEARTKDLRCRWYEVLRPRVDAAVEEALRRAGIEDWMFECEDPTGEDGETYIDVMVRRRRRAG